MIIKNNTTKLLVTLSFLLILPFVQKQWFNLYSLNINDNSFYLILYYLSGAICPSLVYINSLNNYTDYSFTMDKIHSKKIIKGKRLLLLVTISFILILPFVQKQWFNLYSLNINDISFYSILYYLSGAICPSLVYINSLKNYTDYSFTKDKIHSKKIIKGKKLLFLVAINLIFLSYLIADYIYINFDLIFNLFLEGIKLPKPDIPQLSFFIFLISILLIFKKSRFLLKKIILINFILISLYLSLIHI